MDLRYVVFFRCKAEHDAYRRMVCDESYTDEEIAEQEGRYLSAYQIVEEAGLEGDYRLWKATT